MNPSLSSYPAPPSATVPSASSLPPAVSSPSRASSATPALSPAALSVSKTHWHLSFCYSVAIAALIECLVVAALGVWLMARPVHALPEAIPLTIEALVEEPPLAPTQPQPPKVPAAVPMPLQKTLVPPKTAAPAVMRDPTPQPVAAAETPLPVTAPTAFSTPVPAPAIAPPPAMAVPATTHSGPSAEYLAKVKAAVQAAAVYPPAAMELNFRGRTRVEFKLRDGVASQANIITGSGMGLVDRAALQSVRVAVYPPPPAAAQGKEETYQVWVEFNF